MAIGTREAPRPASRSGTSKGTRLGRLRTFAIALATLVVAGHAFTVSFDASLFKRNPALAMQVTGSPQAQVRAWQIAAAREPQSLADPAIRSAAASAIADDPMNAEALRALAYHEDAIGNTPRAASLALLSQEVTRRDEMNQLLLGQIAARAGDLDRAMTHLGTALTTSLRTREEIFALMMPLIGDAQFRPVLAREIGPENDWAAAFVRAALVSDDAGIGNIGDVLLLADPRKAAPVAREVGADLLSRAAYSGDAELTGRLFALLFPGKAPLLRDPDISGATGTAELGLLGWTPLQEGTAGAQLGRTDAGGLGVLAYADGSEAGTPVLRRVMLLPPGEYRLSDRRADDRPARFGWVVSCYRDGAWSPIARQTAPGATRVSIGAQCPMQTIELQVTAPTGRNGKETVIENLRIEPLSSSRAP